MVQTCWVSVLAEGLPHTAPHAPSRSRSLHPTLRAASVPLRPLHIHTCKDAFHLHPDCPDLRISLPEGSQCTKAPAGPPELVIRIPAGP